MIRPSICAVFAIFLAHFAWAEDGAKNEVNPLRGKWKVTKVDLGSGRDDPQMIGATFRFDADGKTVDATIGGKTSAGKYSSDATKTPHQITLTNPGGAPARGIFKIEKDVLMICFTMKNGAEPPKEFAVGKEVNLALMTLERVK